MKLFDIRKNEVRAVALFSALFGLVEGASALALSASEAMFLAGVGVAGLPLAYILLFAVMLCATGALALAQARAPLERVLKIVLWGTGVFVAALSAGFTLWTPPPMLATAMLYALKLAAAVWMYAGFSLYWNFADEHFNIRDGKRLYSVFAAFGCLGAVAGAGLVYGVSEFFKCDAAWLLWLWALAIFAGVPLVSRIQKRCDKLDSGVEQATADTGVFGGLARHFKTMRRSAYIRAILLMYVAVILAAALNEYAALSAFSAHAEAQAAGIADPEAMRAAAQLSLAALFGALGVGVNVFNFIVNLCVYNRLAARFGVGNLALLQPLLFMAAFVWLINAFGVAAAVFSFFMYRGMMESVDANNENLMISVMPGAVRQQVRLMVESFIVPFATALAGVFLMLYAQGETAFTVESERLEEWCERLGFGSLTVYGVCIVGFFAALVALGCAALARREYPKVLERNLREGWLDFSEPAEAVAARHTAEPEGDFDVAGASPAALLAACELWQFSHPERAFRAILENAARLDGAHADRAGRVLEAICARRAFDVGAAAAEWLLDARAAHPDFAVAALARGDALARILAEHADPRAENAYPPPAETELRAARIERLRAMGVSRAAFDENFAVSRLDDADACVRNAALAALAAHPDAVNPAFAEKIAALFKYADEDGARAIVRLLEKIGSDACVETLFRGVSRLSAGLQNDVARLLVGFGPVATPALVAVLKSDAYAVPVKAVCASALHKLFPAQLKTLADEIVDAEFARAYAAAAAEDFCDRAGAEGAALGAFFRRQQRQSVAFAVRVLSLAGRIPSDEVILSGLFSRASKEAGNAIEALETSMDAADFKRLLPLVDGRSAAARRAFGEAHYPVSYTSIADVAQACVQSPFDEAFLAAAAFLFRRGAAAFEGVLCARIGREREGFLRGRLLAFLDEIAFARFAGGKPPADSCVHRFSALALCEIFSDFEPGALCALLPRMRRADNDDEAAPSDGVRVVSDSDGLADARGETVRRGKRLGKGAFFLAREDVLDVARDFPDAAAALYLKWGDARAL